MAIKPVAPGWCENAVPTANGWEDPDTGELYISAGFTTEEIDLFFGAKPKTAQVLTEAPANNKGLDQMNKLELESLAREKGVELDRRKSKATLLQTVKELFS
tara:strand:+ start:677 stop:982 length:306 start_codon:yes stop_codon:yes gene_type:complete